MTEYTARVKFREQSNGVVAVASAEATGEDLEGVGMDALAKAEELFRKAHEQAMKFTAIKQGKTGPRLSK